jgi:ATP-dependent Clp protease ATP-binding subunit ClpA
MRDEAFVLDHDHVGTEHLLLAIAEVNDDLTAPVLRGVGVTVDKLRREVQMLVTPGIDPDASHTTFVLTRRGAEETTEAADRSERVDSLASLREFTPRLLRCLMSLAGIEAEALGDEHIGPEHLLLAVLREGHGVGVQALNKLGVDTDELRRAINERIAEAPEASDVRVPTPTDELHEARLEMRRFLAEARMSPEDRVAFTGSEAARVFCVLDGLDRLFTVDSGTVSERLTEAISESFTRRAGRTDQFTPEQERQILSSIVSSLRRHAADQLGDERS